MKFQPDFLDGVNTIGRYDGTSLVAAGRSYRGPTVVPWSGEIVAWTAHDFASLTQADFDALLPLEPEIVIFGSGATLRFPDPAVLRRLIERRIGVETMDTAAACRTFNVLAAEGRRVVTALLLPRAV